MAKPTQPSRLIGFLVVIILAAGCAKGAAPNAGPGASPGTGPGAAAADPATGGSGVPGGPGAPVGLSLPLIDVSQAAPLSLEMTPPPAGDGPHGLTGATFLTADHGFGATPDGAVVESRDGGATWREVFRDPNARFGPLAFANPDVGVAAAQEGCREQADCPPLLAITADGGRTWTEVRPEGLDKDAVQYWLSSKFAFPSATVGFALPLYGGRLLTTGDGGQHWQGVAFPDGFNPQAFHFLTPDLGYVAGAVGNAEALLLRTRDGGKSWETVFKTTDFRLESVQFLNERQGFLAGGNHPKFGHHRQMLLNTADGGDTWQVVSEQNGQDDSSLEWIHFSDPMTGWAVRRLCYSPDCATLLFTRDGGRTWTPAHTIVHGAPLPAVGSRLWIPFGGALLRTDDGGATFVTLANPAHVTVDYIRFTDRQTGWMHTNAGTYRTGDGGQTWRPYPLGEPLGGPVFGGVPDRPVFVSDTVVFASHGDALLRSEDGGRTWQRQQSNPLSQYSYDFAGEFGWLAVRKLKSGPDPFVASLLRTDDGGRTWTEVQAISPQFMTIAVADSKHGAVATIGPDAELQMTADGASSWAWTGLAGLSVTSISYAGPNHIWMAANNGQNRFYLLDWTVGSTSWSVAEAPKGVGLMQVEFTSPADGWLVGSGNLFATHDGGRTWRQVWPNLPQTAAGYIRFEQRMDK